MNENHRRVASIAFAVLFVAVLAATAAQPVGAAPPKEKEKSTSEFTVKANLVQWWWWTGLWIGDFTATGAIEDRGDAHYAYADGELYLEGEKGSMVISISGETFSVVSGTGAYEGLAATGAAEVSDAHGGNYPKMKISLDGGVLSGEP